MSVYVYRVERRKASFSRNKGLQTLVPTGLHRVQSLRERCSSAQTSFASASHPSLPFSFFRALDKVPLYDYVSSEPRGEEEENPRSAKNQLKECRRPRLLVPAPNPQCCSILTSHFC